MRCGIPFPFELLTTNMTFVRLASNQEIAR